MFQHLFYHPQVEPLFSNEAYIQYLLDFEAALAKAQATCGIIPTQAAIYIEECCKANNIDIAKIISEVGLGGNANIPLIKQLTAVVKQQNEEAAKYVHLGATSQDVIDTAIMLQSKKAVLQIQEGLSIIISQLKNLAQDHLNTPMIGRSFMQQAKPITFGYKVSTWIDGLERSLQRIDHLLKHAFTLQLGGAVGNLASISDGKKVSVAMANLLALQHPTQSWHTQRDRFAEIASTLAILTGSIAKIAKDISLLMQTEIAEVFEPSGAGKGGSSTMPHKRNPVSSIAILANAQRVPSLVATMLNCMVQDHERATGTWHAEWETLSDIIRLTAGTVHQAQIMTNGLEINKINMLKNLDATNGLIFAENISLALASKIGKIQAHHLVEDLCKKSIEEKVHLLTLASTNEIICQHFLLSDIKDFFKV
jgi:3-carboxy-cis,cis-muconate cycloisomerase